MNIKSLLTYLAVLTLSFNVFALEVQEKPKITSPEPISSAVTIALNQENLPADYFAPPIVNNTTPQASFEKPTEFMAELSVYLIIIIIYSIYGFKVNSKNVRN